MSFSGTRCSKRQRCSTFFYLGSIFSRFPLESRTLSFFFLVSVSFFRLSGTKIEIGNLECKPKPQPKTRLTKRSHHKAYGGHGTSGSTFSVSNRCCRQVVCLHCRVYYLPLRCWLRQKSNIRNRIRWQSKW